MRTSVARLYAIDIETDLLDAIRDAVAEGEDGLTFKEAAELLDMRYSQIYGAVNELARMGRVMLAMRTDRNVCRIALPDWSPPEKLDLTAKQQGCLDYLLTVMEDDGISYAAFKEIASSGPVAVGGIVAALDALDKKGFISILLRGKGARRTLFRVYPDGDGPRCYSPMQPMIECPQHLGVPVPIDFAAWGEGKTMAEAVARYGRSPPVLRRWFAEVDITPFKPLCVKKRKKARVVAVPDPVLVYPFLVRDRGAPEHVLMRKVNAAVPRWLPPDRRADICQDLIVAVLCGDIPEEALDLSVKEFTKQVLRQHPTMFGDLSLDAPIGDSDLHIIDTLSTEDSIWNHI